MSFPARLALAAAVLAAASLPAAAHFQEVIPTPALVTANGGRTVAVALTFTHPMDNGPVMAMGAPKRVGVKAGGAVTDLTAQAKATTRGGKAAYDLSYTLPGPGDYTFFIEPAPYWEPAEGKMIVHYAKVVVNALGEEEGWDEPVGLPVEIQPLTRPYGLWTGNVFQGVVTKDGKPVPGAEVEVEYRSEGKVKAPADPFVTQVVKADANGVFTYAMPRAGWWGFAALIDGDTPLKSPDGKDVPVELGALLWVNTQDMK